LNNLKFVSVVIPTYNRKSLLKSCLDSLTLQTYPKSVYEVIVVDDGSTDGTEEFIREYAKNLDINFSYLRQENGGPAKARNYGIRNAKGEFVAFTDDDCEADRDWLEEIVKGFTSEEISGVGGMVLSKNNDILSQYIDYYRVLQPPMDGDTVRYLVTANACYKKEILLNVGGFSEEIKNPGGEDPDLSLKVKELGYRLACNPEAIVLHNHKQDLKSFCRTFYNYGRGAAILRKKWGERAGKDVTLNMNMPMLLYAINILPLLRLMLYLYKRGVGVRKSFLFASLNHVGRSAYMMGMKRGY